MVHSSTCLMIRTKSTFKVITNMKIPKNFDVVAKEAPSFSKGTSMENYKGIQPSESNIKDTPGENATNETSAHSMSKGHPFGKGGSGYTSST